MINKDNLIKVGTLCFLGLGTMAYAQTYDGRVGINTETPSATLNVKSNVNTSSHKNFELETKSGTKLVTVLNSGYVGINKDAPVAPLHIVSPSTGYGNDIIIEDYTTTAGDPSALIFNRNRGTIAAPAVLQKNDNVGQIIFSTKNGGTALASPRMAEIGADFVEGTQGLLYLSTSGTRRMVVKEDGKVQVNNLSGSGDRPVYADKDGVLKIGTPSTNVKANTTTDTCSDTNLGAIHFKEVAISGTNPVEKKGVFGFCTKQNNTAMWIYLSNGGNIMQGTGTFGQGL